MTKNRFLGNTIWILSGQIIKMLISLVISVLTARFLGPSNYGVLNYVNSYIAFFTSLIGLGLNGVIIYEFVNHKDEEGIILGTCIVLRLIASILCSGIFVGLIYLTDGQDEVIILVALLQTIQLPFLAFDTINYWYQSKLLSKKAVIIQTISYIIVSLYKVFLLVTHKGVSWFSFAITLDVVLLAIMYFISYQKNKTQPLKFSWTVAKRILKACGPFILANMMVVVYGQIDKIMIKQLLGNNDLVGLYSAAFAICSLIGFIPMAILDSARPLIVEAKNNDENEFNLKFRQLACAIIWICILYSIAVTFLSYFIIKLLYGDEYLGADICLKIAVWYTAFSYLGSARSLWLICNNLNKYVFIFSALGAIVNVALNFLFIPFLSIEGAAIATLITQILANFIFPLLFKKTRPYAVEVMKSMIFRDVKLKDLLSIIKKRQKRELKIEEDVPMREINLEELKSIQLQLLNIVTEFCDTNNIKYWLDSGTLLGAIRHKGYIPWDDDIDIGMLREDYNKFINTFNSESERFKVKCIENDKKFYYPYAKIVDNNTVLFEPDLNGKKINVNIDLFVYDNVPNNDKIAKKMYNKRDFYRLCEDVHFSHGRPTGNFIRRCSARLFRLYIRLFPRNHFIKKMVKIAKKYSNQKTNHVGNFTGYTAKFVANKEIFNQMIDVEFEGQMYKVPAGFDEWLRLTYGDYMTLPPEDKRVSHHKFRAFIL